MAGRIIFLGIGVILMAIAACVDSRGPEIAVTETDEPAASTYQVLIIDSMPPFVR